MTFHDPEVVGMGLAEDLIQEIIDTPNTEGVPDGFPPARLDGAIYMADLE